MVIKAGTNGNSLPINPDTKKNNWEQSITKTERRDAYLIKDSNGGGGGGGGGGDTDKKVTLTLYMHENNTSGKVLPGVYITGSDGKNQSFSGTTNSYGYVQFTGYISGEKWTFNASIEGYESASWSKSVTDNVTNDGYLMKKSGGGEDDPPPSTYSIGNWISIGPSVYYYREPCGSQINQFDFVNGYQLEDKKFCNNMWWYKVYIEDDDGITGNAWIRGIDINGTISGPSYSVGSTKTFKKGASAYLTICGNVYDTLKNDGNEFSIIDRAYRCNTWWYKVYIGLWKKNVWFKEADIL